MPVPAGVDASAIVPKDTTAMDDSHSEQTALIVGASRGLGLGLAEEYLDRGWRVVATVRGSGRTPLHDLMAEADGRLEIATVDINVPAQIDALRQHLEGRAFDLLFVNAGISNDPNETVADVATEEFTRVMVTNALSPMRVIEALVALVRPTGTIGVMSSGLGSVADNNDGGFEIYRASKAALNTLMRSFAARGASDHRTLLLIAPGWVRTDMGGPHADLSVEESAQGVVDTISLQSGRAGLHYLDYRGRTIRW
jgi:NAD(P)-dependent dehydrogenase (short-subunit alcohol dehydrogenase family)